MALSGVPFLFSGFWSKEAILHAAHEWKAAPARALFGLHSRSWLTAQHDA